MIPPQVGYGASLCERIARMKRADHLRRFRGFRGESTGVMVISSISQTMRTLIIPATNALCNVTPPLCVFFNYFQQFRRG